MTINVLYVDDEPALLELFRLFLGQEPGFQVRTAASGREALMELARSPVDVVVSDYQMPVMNGIELLKACRRDFGEIPFILFTGRGREEIVIEAIDNGADFYLQKGGEPEAQFAELLHKCRQAVRRRRAEAALRESEARHREMAERISEIVLLLDEHGVPVYVSPSMERVTGYSPDHVVGHPLDPGMIDVRALSAIRASEADMQAGRPSPPITIESRRRDGEPIVLEGTGVPVVRDGRFRGVQVVLRDITERRRTEDELRAAYEHLSAAEEELRQSFDELKASETDLRASEERVRALLESTPTGLHLYRLEPDGRLVFQGGNPAADRILGRDHASIVGLSIEEAFPGLAGTEIPERYRDVARTGVPFVQEDVPYREEGNERAYEVSAFRFGPGEVAAQFIEVTRHLVLERELRRLSREWEGVFQAIGHPVLILGTDQAILSANRAALHAIGLDLASLWGRRCYEVFHHAAAPPDGCPFRRLFEQGDAGGSVEMVVESLNGTFLVTCNPIYDDRGRVSKVIHTMTEITDRVQNEKALREAHARIALLTSLTRHDLRNRMMVVQGYLRLAERESDPETAAHHRELALRNVAMMERILEFTTDYERVGARAPEWQQVATVVRQALGEVELEGIRLEIEAGDREVLADPLLRKVFSNLMDNTVRYGGCVSRIRVETRAEGDALVIVYTDDGVGIDDAEKTRIFEKGFGKNTGLGLYLVPQILGITGVSIVENGRPGEGVRFELCCPRGTWR
ncbi:MAG: PAS domain S-box protein [Methanoregulaceae archaeon]